jgi:hypothetical protein
MGKINLPEKVCFITAVCYSDPNLLDVVLQKMQKQYGPIAESSRVVDFSYTNYYEDEMGSHLEKKYYSFVEHIDPVTLPDIKIYTNSIEDEFTEKSNRLVNIDPGYIELAKLILGTTKNFSHRIYIGKGIYGDVQLFWKGGGFNTNPWTYPDYKSDDIKSFFEAVRMKYFNQLRGH